jgi:hypothetical protein
MLRPLMGTALWFFLLVPIPGCAATLLFESGSYGGPANGGFLLAEVQFAGARLEVSQNEQVTAVGGNLGFFSSGSVFAAIVSLNENGFPSGAPTDLNPLAATTFTGDLTFETSDVSTPLSATLTPGTYGLVFGSGLFGANSNGGIIAENNPQLPNEGYFYYTSMLGNTWLPVSNEDLRFTVYGESSAPEPYVFLLTGSGLLLLFVFKACHLTVITVPNSTPVFDMPMSKQVSAEPWFISRGADLETERSAPTLPALSLPHNS